jgi:hypothetical protein
VTTRGSSAAEGLALGRKCVAGVPMCAHRHTHARGRRRRRRYRKRGEELELERAFAEAWAQRAWEPARHDTPMGLCFPSTEAWRAWLHRVQECCGGVDLRTVTTCEPVVLMLFQERSGRWLDATTIEQLVLLTRPGAHRGPGVCAHSRSRESTGCCSSTRPRRLSEAQRSTGDRYGDGRSPHEGETVLVGWYPKHDGAGEDLTGRHAPAPA